MRKDIKLCHVWRGLQILCPDYEQSLYLANEL